MPTEIEWREAFACLEGGESSYEKEGRKLGADKSTVFRRYAAWLQERVNAKARELAGVEGRIGSLTKKVEGLEGKLKNLSGDYIARRTDEERKLAGALKGSKSELGAVRTKIFKLKKLAGRQNLSLDKALALLLKIPDLTGVVRDLTGKRDSLSSEVARGKETLSGLKVEKSDLEGAIRIRSSYSGQLQQQINQLGAVYNQLQGWWQRDGAKLAQRKEVLESQLPGLRVLVSNLKAEGTELEKEVEGLASKKEELAEVENRYKITAKRLSELYAVAASQV